MQEWEPLLKNQNLEPFVDEPQSQKIVGGVFTGMGLMVLAGLMAILFYWTYQKDKTLFIAVYSGVLFLFALEMLVLIAVIRQKLNAIVFRIYIGSSVFFCLVTLFMLMYFSFRAMQRLRGSSSPSSYAPPPPSYGNPDSGES